MTSAEEDGNPGAKALLAAEQNGDMVASFSSLQYI